jgi:hypothetical protein
MSKLKEAQNAIEVQAGQLVALQRWRRWWKIDARTKITRWALWRGPFAVNAHAHKLERGDYDAGIGRTMCGVI